MYPTLPSSLDRHVWEISREKHLEPSRVVDAWAAASNAGLGGIKTAGVVTIQYHHRHPSRKTDPGKTAVREKMLVQSLRCGDQGMGASRQPQIINLPPLPKSLDSMASLRLAQHQSL